METAGDSGTSSTSPSSPGYASSSSPSPPSSSSSSSSSSPSPPSFSSSSSSSSPSPPSFSSSSSSSSPSPPSSSSSSSSSSPSPPPPSSSPSSSPSSLSSSSSSSSSPSPPSFSSSSSSSFSSSPWPPSSSSSFPSSSVPLYVAFASQTGTAAEAARDLGREMLLLWQKENEKKVSSSSPSLPPPAVVSAEDLLLLPAFRRLAAASPLSPKTRTAPTENLAHGEREDAVVVFVVATTGYGEMPENAQKFWRLLLRASLPPNLLTNLKFAIFGLGDRLYRQFNFAARKLQMRLKQLGAQEFYRIGLGDDQHDFGYEGEFDPWIAGLLPSLLSLYCPSTASSPSSPASPTEDQRLPPCLYSVRVLPEQTADARLGTDEQAPLLEAKAAASPPRHTTAQDGQREAALFASPLMKEIDEKRISETAQDQMKRGTDIVGRVVSNRRLTPASHFQKIHLLQLAVPRRLVREAFADPCGGAVEAGERDASEESAHASWRLVPGSVCSISPLLPPRLTHAFLDAMNLPAHARLEIRPNRALAALGGDGESPETERDVKARGETHDSSAAGEGRRAGDGGVVVRAWDLFTQVVDVSGRPSRFLLKLLASWISQPLLKEKLLFLSSRSLEAKDEFCAYCRDERRTIAEVCWDFSCNATRASSSPVSLASAPLSDIVSALPLIQRRKYSIANFVSVSPAKNAGKRPQGENGSTAEKNSDASGSGESGKVEGVRWLLASPFLLRMRAPALFLWLGAESRARCIDTLVAAEERAGGEATAAGQDEELLVEMCYAVAEAETVSMRRCVGVCSSFLSELPVGCVIPFSIEPSKLPPCFFDLKTRLILISPGTGVAPTRALVQQRHAAWLAAAERAKAEAVPARDAGTRANLERASAFGDERLAEKAGRRERDLVFLGFRHEQADFLFADEWDMFTPWIDVHVAFSRDGVYRHLSRDPTTNEPKATTRRLGDKKKIYVQDLLEETSEEVASLLIESDAAVLISGRAHPMPSQVEDILVEILEKQGGLSTDAARRFLADKKRRKRYFCDTWG
ncbi:hypothetical protein NCLIV_065520 [Neospora caninum Liverpool]|uniref:Flavodoxin domain-containing protein n=1 Tax=Neospora caninum (strain Liverpool) TaxID=572307 RepID=F0VQX9_NEOCL|nr:hypothetical protein NCLIV_065520 [Neospora caninum Liverpool]CBZ56126.1 hypothetical protein NCLIV_065520 [Neospora caninum Liverpool]CEL70881.1 TPA: flavodoxin domain-containing protein [Neospora caninum Liverpool]|eukprot:XP_003886152.1 hypothetical protein NCLIV_065520 [Neospora caninum Liverpool]